jgi:proline iminopeptidase
MTKINLNRCLSYEKRWDTSEGRYDVICPPISAYRLHQVWPNAKLHMIANAGHAAMEPGIVTELVRATEQFKLYNKFL